MRPPGPADRPALSRGNQRDHTALCCRASMNLHDLFAIPLRRSPDRPALRFVADGGAAVDLSYAQLFAMADRLAAGFRARGVQKGDRVAFFLGNRPEFVAAYLAVIRLGAVMVPINLAYRRRDIGHMLTHATPRLLLTEPSQLAVLDHLGEAERGGRPGDVLAGERAGVARRRLCCSGSAPLAAEPFAAFRGLSGHDVLERYGMTETGMNLSNPYAGPRRPGTVGTPLPGVSARIVDVEGREVAAGVEGGEGELLVRGGNVFDGYWQAPEKTAESFLADAEGRRWFRTGDLARQDPETGYFALLGRRSELIISGGFNLYPREVEEVLASFPGVQEAAVVGRPHTEWGEVPVAFLVTDREVDTDELIAFCRGQLAAFKVPRSYRFLTSLPRNALGKVQKHLLSQGE